MAFIRIINTPGAVVWGLLVGDKVGAMDLL